MNYTINQVTLSLEESSTCIPFPLTMGRGRFYKEGLTPLLNTPPQYQPGKRRGEGSLPRNGGETVGVWDVVTKLERKVVLTFFPSLLTISNKNRK